MPLYEYECSKCHDRIELIQKFSDPPMRRHSGCGGSTKRVLHAPTVLFLGGGWTPKTDNRTPEERGRRTEQALMDGHTDFIDSYKEQ
jgi:putative FmdB family regulatory protein